MNRTEREEPVRSALTNESNLDRSVSAGSKPNRRVRRSVGAAAGIVGVAALLGTAWTSSDATAPTSSLSQSVHTAFALTSAPTFATDEAESLQEPSGEEPLEASAIPVRQVSQLPTTQLVIEGKRVEVRDGVALVKPVTAEQAELALETLGANVLRKSPSGFWRVSVPEGQSLETFLVTLGQQPAFSMVHPEGIVRSASLANGTATYRNMQWNLDQMHWDHTLFGDEIDTQSLANVTVAIIDSGVAYENRVDGDTSYVASPDLAHSDIHVGPDFVDEDGHPNDLSGHGTHIANIVAANGGTFGIAPGVKLMPIRVLNGDNAGSELDLVDAVQYAVDHGADVINMSLSFPVGYLPVTAMADAVQSAADNQVTVVAASGNSGVDVVSYPAAYATTIAVGASRLTAGGMSWVAPYSNTGSALDVVAPGGSNAMDVNNDGKADGIAAQSIEPHNPSVLHYYLMSGTSQASAHVAGQAALLLSMGADIDDTRQAIVNTSGGIWGKHQFWTRQGLGLASVTKAVNAVEQNTLAVTSQQQYYVNVQPMLFQSNGKWGAVGMIQVVKPNGLPANRVLVSGHWFGSMDSTFGVVTNNQGKALIASLSDAPTNGIAPAFFGLQVDRVIDGTAGISLPPLGYFYASSGLKSAVVDWMANNATSGSTVLFKATPGATNLPSWISEHYVLRTLGGVNAYAPMALAFNQQYLDALIVSNPNGFANHTTTFASAQSFGWGNSSSLTIQVASGVTLLNGNASRLIVAPLDPALYFGNLATVALMVNFPLSSWQSESTAFWAALSSNAVGAGALGTILGDGALGTILGDGALGSILGDGALGTILGDGALGTILGDGALGTILGDSGDMVVMCEGALGSILGDSISVELLGSSLEVPVMVASSTVDANGATSVLLDALPTISAGDSITVTPDEE